MAGHHARVVDDARDPSEAGIAPTPERIEPRDAPALARWVDRAWQWRLLPPVGLAAAVAVLVFVFLNPWFVDTVKLVIGYQLTPVGKEVWFAAGTAGLDLPLWYVFAILLLVEASVSLFFALVPPVERLLARLPRIGSRVLEWERRIRASRSGQYGLATGLAVLVMLPIHSGGSILGPLVGRSLGLHWYQAYGAVMLGTLVRLAAVAGLWGSLAAIFGWS